MTPRQAQTTKQASLPERTIQRIQHWWTRAFKRKALRCPTCTLELAHSDLYKRVGVCERCGHHFPITALQRIELLTDPRSFVEVDRKLRAAPLANVSIEETYPRKLKEA